MIATPTAPKLDAREEHFRIPSPHPGLSLFLRYLPRRSRPGRPCCMCMAGRFASGVSIAHRFDGRSWRDELCAAGFHVWGLDFHGFGRWSDRYPENGGTGGTPAPLGRAADASRQLEQAVRFICAHHGVARISLIAHSWGSIVAGHFAVRCPDLVDRLVFFGPIARRDRTGDTAHLPGWRLISLQDQWTVSLRTFLLSEPAVLLKRHFDEWGEAWLDDGDADSRTRSPAAVKTPSGAFQDIFDAWAGELAYDPGLIRAPVAIIRGEWDGMCPDTDARWLFQALRASPIRRDVKIGRATHLMHLEAGRYALYRETKTFLSGRDGCRA